MLQQLAQILRVAVEFALVVIPLRYVANGLYLILLLGQLRV
jgi:hypothetical protein